MYKSTVNCSQLELLLEYSLYSGQWDKRSKHKEKPQIKEIDIVAKCSSFISYPIAFLSQQNKHSRNNTILSFLQ